MSKQTEVKLLLKGDNKDAKRSIIELQNAANNFDKEISKMDTTIKLEGDTSGLNSATNNAKGMIDSIEDENVTNLEGDASDLISSTDNAEGAIDGIPDENITNLEGDASNLISSADNAEGAINGVPDENTTNLNGNSSSVISSADNAKGAINSIPDEKTTTLNLDSSGFQAGLGELQAGVGKAVGAFASIKGGGSILTGGFDNATNSAIEFEASLAKVSTLISDDVGVNMDQLANDLQEISLRTGATTTELSEGLYSALSAGIPVTEDMGEALQFVEDSSKLATAGFTDTEKAVDVTTTVLNAYGLEVSEASNVMNTLIETQNAGKTTVDELANSMGKAIPGASQLGVNFQELSSAMAVMTANGIGTAEATTMISAFFKEANDSTSKYNETMKKLSGKTMPEYLAAGNSLSDMLILMNGYLKDQGMNWGDISSSSEAATAAYTLTKDGGESLIEVTKRLTDDNYELEESFNKVSETAKFNISVIKQGMTGALQDLGFVILEHLNPALEYLADNIEIIAPIALKVAAAIGVLLVTFGLIIGATLLWTAVTTVLGVAIAVLTSPITLVIAAIVGLGYAIYRLLDYFGYLDEAIEFLKLGLMALAKIVETIVKGIYDIVMWAINGIVDAVKSFTQFLNDHFSEQLEFLYKIWESVWTSIKDLFSAFIDLFQAIIDGEWKEAFKMLVKVVLSAGVLVAKIFFAIPIFFWKMLMDLTAFIANEFTELWEKFKEIVKNAINAAVEYIKTFPSRFMEMVISLKEKIVSVWVELWETFKTIVRNAVNSVISYIKSIPGRFVEMVVSLKEKIVSSWKNAWDTFKNISKNAVNATINGFMSIPGKIVSMISNFASIVSGAWSETWRSFANAPIKAINLMLNGIENGMNYMLSGLNSAMTSAANLVNKVPGVDISVGSAAQVSIPNIPYFAKGGIVNGAGLGVIGEAGPEMILPLNSQGAAFFDKILGDSIGQGMKGGNSVIVNVEGDMVALDPEQMKNDILNSVDENLGALFK